MCVKIIIAGSRSFSNFLFLEQKVMEVIAKYQGEVIEIISGHARGTDMMGEQFAKKYGYKLTTFEADWNTYGRGAGHRRNKQMADYATCNNDTPVLIAFSHNNSVGTENMIKYAKEKNIAVYKFNV